MPSFSKVRLLAALLGTAGVAEAIFPQSRQLVGSEMTEDTKEKEEKEPATTSVALSGKVSVLNANGAELTEAGFEEFSERLNDTVKDDFITMIEVESFKMTKEQRQNIADNMADSGVAVFESKRVDSMAFRNVNSSFFEFDENKAAWDSKKKNNGNKGSNAAMYYVLAMVKKEYGAENNFANLTKEKIQKYRHAAATVFTDETTPREYSDRKEGIQEVIGQLGASKYPFLEEWKTFAGEKQLSGFLRKALGDDILVHLAKMLGYEGYAYNYINMNKCQEYLGSISAITVADSAHTTFVARKITIGGEEVTFPEPNSISSKFKYVDVENNVKTVPIVLQNDGGKALLFLGWHEKSKFLLGKEDKIKLDQYKDRTAMFLGMEWTKGGIVGGGDSNALGRQKVEDMVKESKNTAAWIKYAEDITSMHNESQHLITMKEDHSPYWMEESLNQNDSAEKDQMNKYFKRKWDKGFDVLSHTDKLKVLFSKDVVDKMQDVVKLVETVATEDEMAPWCKGSTKPNKIWLKYEGNAKEIMKDEFFQIKKKKEENQQELIKRMCRWPWTRYWPIDDGAPSQRDLRNWVVTLYPVQVDCYCAGIKRAIQDFQKYRVQQRDWWYKEHVEWLNKEYVGSIYQQAIVNAIRKTKLVEPPLPKELGKLIEEFSCDFSNFLKKEDLIKIMQEALQEQNLSIVELRSWVETLESEDVVKYKKNVEGAIQAFRKYQDFLKKKIKKVMTATGTGFWIAKDLLENNEWDTSKAIIAYNEKIKEVKKEAVVGLPEALSALNANNWDVEEAITSIKKIKKVMTATGTGFCIAEDLLENNEWDTSKAIIAYTKIHHGKSMNVLTKDFKNFDLGDHGKSMNVLTKDFKNFDLGGSEQETTKEDEESTKETDKKRAKERGPMKEEANEKGCAGNGGGK